VSPDPLKERLVEAAAQHSFHFDTSQMPLSVMYAHFAASGTMCFPSWWNILDRGIEAARTFQPMSPSEVSALLAKTKDAAVTGQFEPFKTPTQFDGTAQNPNWMG
jgi:hypothetical protein